jgi:hypothetical protein
MTKGGLIGTCYNKVGMNCINSILTLLRNTVTMIFALENINPKQSH